MFPIRIFKNRIYLTTSYDSILGFHIIWFLSCHWPRLNIIDDLPENVFLSGCDYAVLKSVFVLERCRFEILVILVNHCS